MGTRYQISDLCEDGSRRVEVFLRDFLSCRGFEQALETQRRCAKLTSFWWSASGGGFQRTATLDLVVPIFALASIGSALHVAVQPLCIKSVAVTPFRDRAESCRACTERVRTGRDVRRRVLSRGRLGKVSSRCERRMPAQGRRLRTTAACSASKPCACTAAADASSAARPRVAMIFAYQWYESLGMRRPVA